MTFGEGKDDVKPVFRLKWNWKEADWEDYKKWLMEQVKHTKWERLKAKEIWNKLSPIILKAARKFVGKKRVNVADEVGFSANIRKAIRARDELRRDDVATEEEIHLADERVRELIKEAKVSQWEDLLAKNASYSEMWSVVKGVSRRVNGCCSENVAIEVEGKVINTDREMANKFIKM